METESPKKRKIAIVGSAHPLRGGGIATFNERLAKAFQENGDEVKIFTFSLQYPDFLFPGKTQYSEEPAPEGLDIEVLVNSINPANWIKSGYYIKGVAPDIVILRYWIPFIGPCLGTISRIIRKNKKTKIIAIIDNAVPHEKKPGDKLFSNYFFKSVDAFLTMSKSVLTDLEKFDSVKPKIFTPHPLYDNFGEVIPKNIAKERLKLDKQFHYILFFGFIRDYKGLDILLKAFAQKKIREFPVKLIVAGEFYTSPDKYIGIINNNNLENYIELRTEFIPNSEVHKYFCAADVVVQPYKSATQSGITQIAYHFNKPIITTNVGGLSEIVADNKVGYVVEPDENQIADAIYRFFKENNEDRFSKYSENEKKNYSWDTFTEKIYGLHHLLLGNTEKEPE